MKAVVVDANVTGHLTLGETPEPIPDSNEVLIRVTAFSLNRGEVRRAETASPGTQIVWDTVGDCRAGRARRQRASKGRAGGRILTSHAGLGRESRLAHAQHCRNPV